MAKISALDVTTELTGDELLPIVQDATTKRATMRAFRDLITPFLQYWYKGDRGDTGPADSSYPTLAAMKAAPTTHLSYMLVRGGELVPYAFVDGDFTGRTNDIDTIAHDDVPESKGAFVRLSAGAVTFRSKGSPLTRSTADKTSETVSVLDWGAIGDGSSHPVREWIIPGVRGRYRSLAEVKADYPDVRTLDDEIDFAAMNAALRYLGTRGGGTLRFPAGIYLGWVYVRFNNIVLIGDGATTTRIKIPDGALHTQPDEAGTGVVTGTPTVIDCGHLSRGNNAPRYSGFRLQGLTLDGNAPNTAAPLKPAPGNPLANDVNGWGLAFTNFANVSYTDLVAINCHMGGVGTFIRSDYHRGTATVERCGFAQAVPGFDVNSSRHGDWKVTSKSCAVGARLLDNGWNNQLRAVIENAGTYGLLYNNQQEAPQNASDTTHITATIRGGCSIAGFQIGSKCSNSIIATSIFGVNGIGMRQVKQVDAPVDSRGLIVTVQTSETGEQAVVVGGRGGMWTINASNAARDGDNFAVDVEGSHNILSVALSDTDPPKSRGVAFRAGANANCLANYVWNNTVQPLLDQGEGNRTPDLRLNDWSDAIMNSGYGNAFGGANPAIGYTRTDNDYVEYRGNIAGPLGAAFKVPQELAPPYVVAFGDANAGFINVDGTVVLTSGSGPWRLAGLRYRLYGRG